MSADGRWVVFTSEASDLVSGDRNTCSMWTDPGSCPDVFLRDMLTGETRLVSLGEDGMGRNQMSYAPAISADAGVVVFISFANLVAGFEDACASVEYPGDCQGLYIYDVASHLTRLLLATSDNGGEGGDHYIAVSADGAWVGVRVYDRKVLGRWTDAADGIVVIDANSGDAVLATDSRDDPLITAR